MSRHTRLLAPLSMAALFSLGLAAGRPAAQQADAPQTATPKPIAPSKKAARSESAAFLEVRGEVGTPQLYSKEEFARLPRQTVKAKGHDGVESKYEGVPLIALVDRAGAPSGAQLKGRMALSLLPRRRGRRRLPRGLHAPRARSRLHRPDDPPGRPPRRQAALRSRGPAPGDRARREEHAALGPPDDPARGQPGVMRGIVPSRV